MDRDPERGVDRVPQVARVGDERADELRRQREVDEGRRGVLLQPALLNLSNFLLFYKFGFS